MFPVCSRVEASTRFSNHIILDQGCCAIGQVSRNVTQGTKPYMDQLCLVSTYESFTINFKDIDIIQGVLLIKTYTDQLLGQFVDLHDLKIYR